ncbi:MAG: MarR family winged helix-turn-helix transcriptional regulator [Pleomorphochaeta sp.]
MDLQLKVFIAMNRALKKININNNRVLRDYNLTSSQFAVLEALYHKGELSVGDVQDKILSSSGTIALIIRNLEKNELLYRRTCKYDKRKFLLQISKKGKSLIESVYPIIEKNIVDNIDNLDEKEQENILLCLKKMSGYDYEKKS